MKKSSTRCRRGVWFLGAAILGGATLFGALMAFLDTCGQTDRAHDAAARNVDAIVVLGSRVKADGSAGNSLTRRARHAAALYHEKVAPFVICTGAIGDYAPSEAQSAALILQREGVPQSAILLEEQSHSTWENIVNATAICRSRGWTKVVVVSEPYHLWRAGRNFRDCGIEAFPSPAPNPPPRWRLQMAARECLSVARDFFLGHCIMGGCNAAVNVGREVPRLRGGVRAEQMKILKDFQNSFLSITKRLALDDRIAKYTRCKANLNIFWTYLEKRRELRLVLERRRQNSFFRQ